MSIYYDILQSVKTNVETAVAAYNIPVYVKRRVILGVEETLPCIVVAPQGSEEVEYMDFCDHVTYLYPVTIGLIWAENTREAAMDADAALFLDISQAIRNAIINPFFITQDVPYAWNTKFLGTKPFGQDDIKQTYSIKQWELQVSNNEDRVVS